MRKNLTHKLMPTTEWRRHSFDEIDSASSLLFWLNAKALRKRNLELLQELQKEPRLLLWDES